MATVKISKVESTVTTLEVEILTGESKASFMDKLSDGTYIIDTDHRIRDRSGDRVGEIYSDRRVGTTTYR